MNQRRIRFLLCSLVFFLLPQLVFANAGTPLIWVKSIHLFLGNALLGIIEGFILAIVLKLKVPTTILLLVVANYISAWIGGGIAMFWVIDWIDPTIENIGIWLWGFMAIAFAFTLIFEAPFYYFAARKKKHPLRKQALVLLLIHCFTYSGLVLIYAKASANSMITQLEIVPFATLDIPGNYQFYYLSQDREYLMRHSMNETPPTRLQGLPTDDRNYELAALRTENDRLDLVLKPNYYYDESKTNFELVADFAGDAIVGPYSVYRMPVPKLTDSTEWDYKTTDWAGFGIYGYFQGNNNGALFRYAIETPFSSWRILYPTHIEGDFVIFQLGWDQICILQPIDRKIALITRGRNPVVYRPKPTTTETFDSANSN